MDADSIPSADARIPQLDWDALPEQLPCPRCGYNLRMLTAARCPECGVEFDWQLVVASARQAANSPLFEHRWRRRFFGSFVGTSLRLFRPIRFWKATPLEYAPRIGPLLLHLLMVAMLFTLIRSTFGYVQWMARQTGGEWPSAIDIWRWIVFDYVTNGARALKWTLHEAMYLELGHLFFAALLTALVAVLWQTRKAHAIRGDLLLRLAVYSYISAELLTALMSVVTYWLFLPQSANAFTIYFSPTIFFHAAFLLAFGGGLAIHVRVRHGWFTPIMLLPLALLVEFGISAFASTFAQSLTDPTFSLVRELTFTDWIWQSVWR